MTDGNKIYTTIDGKDVQIATIVTENKTDYVYNNNFELVATIYNNDYKLGKVLRKLTEEIEGAKHVWRCKNRRWGL